MKFPCVVVTPFRGPMRSGALAAALLLSIAGCAGSSASRLDPDPVPPTSEARLAQVLKAADRPPTVWSPAVTIPLSPVLLVVDTTCKLAVATVAKVTEMILGRPEEAPPVPVPVERQAEMLERK